ncbi:MAG TPA: general secretion pathway protein GspB [Geobacteraceae bacterium]|nr:general secretion pathway protein GspB [Geobacteraceae bacterium]
MSSILKALKKLEQEKAMRREGEIDLSREILHGPTRRKKRFSWQWPAAITTIVLLFAIVAILLTRETTTVKPEQHPTPLREAQLPSTPAPVAAEKISPRPADAPRLEAVPVYKPAKVSAANPAPTRIPTPLSPPQQPSMQAPSLPPAAPPVTATAPRVEPARKQAPPAPVDPAFAVSGIAWNKDSADRLAIVNGQPLTTGSFLDGAVVEEILPDRVRFSQGGKTFEVPLGKSGKTH